MVQLYFKELCVEGINIYTCLDDSTLYLYIAAHMPCRCLPTTKLYNIIIYDRMIYVVTLIIGRGE
jgi:hypothetical protein